MKKLLKTALSLLALTGTLYAGGCTGDKNDTPEETPIVIPVYDGVTSILAQEHQVNMFVEETSQLNVESLPRGIKAKLKYKVADESVATVDENGLLTAVGAGTTQVVVSNSNESVTKTIPVNVTTNDLKSMNRSMLVNAINKKLDKYPDTVRIYENSDNVRYFNDRKINAENSDQEMIISKSNAFFQIIGYDKTSKCEDGSVGLLNWGWIVYTNEYFDTYIYHIDGYTKKYCVVSTTSYLEKDGGRYAAMKGVLDNLFTTGSGIVDIYLEYSSGSDIISLGSQSKSKAGSLGEGNIMFSYPETGPAEVKNNEEDDEDLPAGTQGVYSLILKGYFDNYVSLYREIDMTTQYDLNGDIVTDKVLRRMTFDHKIENIEYPNKDDYSKVDSFMDL